MQEVKSHEHVGNHGALSGNYSFDNSQDVAFSGIQKNSATGHRMSVLVNQASHNSSLPQSSFLHDSGSGRSAKPLQNSASSSKQKGGSSHQVTAQTISAQPSQYSGQSISMRFASNRVNNALGQADTVKEY